MRSMADSVPECARLLDIFALLVLGLFVAALLERAWDVAWTSYVDEIRSNTPTRMPLAWAQLPWFAGIALFFITLVLAVLRSGLAVLRGDYAAAAAIAGAATQDEEIESELEGLGIQKPKRRARGTRTMIVTTLLLLIVLLAISVPVAAVMGVLGLALNQFYSSMPLHRAMGEIIWNSSSEYILIAIPLFVMLGEILLRAGIAERVYNAIAQWLSWLPGGLMHANIGILRHVRCDVGLERGHGRDDRDGGVAGNPEAQI